MQDKEIIFGWINDFVCRYKDTHEISTRWKPPICAVADANDPLYAKLKTIIGAWHLLPSEILPCAKSVVVFFIPFEEDIPQSNVVGEESSVEWDIAYLETNKMIADLVDNVCEKIENTGHRAAKTAVTLHFDTEAETDDRALLTSAWSQRSSAYIAGLGKFGINNMIITEQGCCGRIGSLVTDWKLQPTPREDKEYCLFKIDGSCRECIKRCPCHALQIQNSKAVFDKIACKKQIYNKLIRTFPLGLADTCGKCKVNLPCSFKNPAK